MRKSIKRVFKKTTVYLMCVVMLFSCTPAFALEGLPDGGSAAAQEPQVDIQWDLGTEQTAGSDEGAEPQSGEPAEPQSEEPAAQPQSGEPAAEPQSGEPAAEPQTEEPAQPQSEQPAEPQSEEPAEPQSEQPAEPQSGEPAQPQTEEPAEPQSEEPAEPQSEEPAEEQPENTEEQVDFSRVFDLYSRISGLPKPDEIAKIDAAEDANNLFAYISDIYNAYNALSDASKAKFETLDPSKRQALEAANAALIARMQELKSAEQQLKDELADVIARINALPANAEIEALAETEKLNELRLEINDIKLCAQSCSEAAVDYYRHNYLPLLDEKLNLILGKLQTEYYSLSAELRAVFSSDDYYGLPELLRELVNSASELPANAQLEKQTDRYDIWQTKGEISLIKAKADSMTTAKKRAVALGVDQSEITADDLLTAEELAYYKETLLPLLNEKAAILDSNLKTSEWDSLSDVIKDALNGALAGDDYDSLSEEFKAIIALINTLPLTEDETAGIYLDGSGTGNSDITPLITLVTRTIPNAAAELSDEEQDIYSAAFGELIGPNMAVHKALLARRTEIKGTPYDAKHAYFTVTDSFRAAVSDWEITRTGVTPNTSSKPNGNNDNGWMGYSEQYNTVDFSLSDEKVTLKYNGHKKSYTGSVERTYTLKVKSLNTGTNRGDKHYYFSSLYIANSGTYYSAFSNKQVEIGDKYDREIKIEYSSRTVATPPTNYQHGTYNGSTRYPDTSGTGTIYSSGAGSSVGTYTLYYSLYNSDYCWSDGSTSGNKSITYYIDKANNSVSLTTASKTASVPYDQKTKQTFTLTPSATFNSGGTTFSKKSEKNASGSNTTYLSVASNGVVSVATYTPIGTYTLQVTMSIPGTSNYYDASSTGTCTVTVTKATASATTAPAAKSLTYTGYDQTLVSAASGVQGGTVYYGLGTGSSSSYAPTSWSTSLPTGKDYGTYYVWYKIVADSSGNYTDKAATYACYVTIQKKQVTVTWDNKVTAYGDAVPTWTYTVNSLGNPSDVLATGKSNTIKNSSGGVISPSTGTAVGTYTITGTVSSISSNYSVTGYTNGTWTVKKAKGKVNTVPTAATGLTYNGSSKYLITTTGSGTGTMNFTVTDTSYAAPPSSASWSDSRPTATNAGKYRVWYVAIESTSYLRTDPAYVDVTIAKATNPTVVSTTVQKVNVNYSTSDQPKAIPGVSGNKGTLSYSIKSQPSGGYFSIAGGNIVVAKNTPAAPSSPYTVVLNVTDSESDNYLEGKYTLTLQVTVAKGTPTITAGTLASGLKYNGSDQALITKAVSSEGGTVYYGMYRGTSTTTKPSSWSTEFPVAKDYDTNYQVWYKVVGDSNWNNVAETRMGKTGIAKADLQLSVTNGADTYSKFETDGGATVEALNALDGYTVSYGASSGTYNKTEVPKYINAGTYTVYYKVSGGSNYNDKTGSLKIVISPYNIGLGSIDTLPDHPDYAGTYANPVPTVHALETVLTNNVDYTYAYSHVVPLTAEPYSADQTLTVTGKGNYTGTITATYTETRKTYSVKYMGNPIGDAESTEATNIPDDDIKRWGVVYNMSDRIPVRERYDFVGWAYTSGATVPLANVTATKNEDIVLYAIWTPTNTKYKATWYELQPDGSYTYKGISAELSDHKYLETVTTSAFKNTYENGDEKPNTTYLGGRLADSNPATVKNPAFEDSVKLGWNNTVIQLFYRVDFTVKFDIFGVSEMAKPADQVILKGGKALRPAADSDSAYEASGWYTKYTTDGSGNKVFNKDDEWVFNSNTVTKNMTLYANLVPKKYTLKLAVDTSNKNSDSEPEADMQNKVWGKISQSTIANVPYGSVITVSGNQLIVPTPAGNVTVQAIPAATDNGYTYSFDKFTVDGGTSAVSSVTMGKTTTITAHFKRTARTYGVALDAAGGEIAAGKNVTGYTYGTLTQLPVSNNNGIKDAGDEVYRAGYDFMGWSPVGTLGTVSSISAATSGNLNFAAVWRPRNDIKYTVKHIKQNVDGSFEGGAVETENRSDGTADASRIVPVKSYTGFTSPDPANCFISADGSTVVEYQYTRKSFTVGMASADTSMGSVDTLYVMDVLYEAPVTAEGNKLKINGSVVATATPAEATVQYEYIFKQWEKSGTAIGSTPATGVKAEQGDIYKAVFERKAREYTVTYVTGTGSLEEQVPYGESIKDFYDSKYPDDAPEKAEDHAATYKYVGWGVEGIAVEEVKEDITVTPVFTVKSAKKYMVNFDANGGYFEGDTGLTKINGLLLQYGTAPALPAGTKIEKDGAEPGYIYQFVGWKTGPEASSANAPNIGDAITMPGVSPGDPGTFAGEADNTWVVPTYYALYLERPDIKTYTVTTVCDSESSNCGSVGIASYKETSAGSKLTYTVETATIAGTGTVYAKSSTLSLSSPAGSVILTADAVAKTADVSYTYAFDCWKVQKKDEDGANIGQPEIIDAAEGCTVGTDMEVIAYFKRIPKTYNITYHLGFDNTAGISFVNTAGSVYIPPASYICGELLALPKLEKSGYSFSGWVEGVDVDAPALYTDVVPANANGDKHYYAQWKANEHTVIFREIDGIDQHDFAASRTFTTEDAPVSVSVVPVITKKGHIMLGWFGGSSADVPITTLLTEEDFAVNHASSDRYARWKAETYTLVYNVNNDEIVGITPENSQIEYGETFAGKLPELIYAADSSYVFRGWYTNEACSGSALTQASVMNTDAGADGAGFVLYAKWEKLESHSVQIISKSVFDGTDITGVGRVSVSPELTEGKVIGGREYTFTAEDVTDESGNILYEFDSWRIGNNSYRDAENPYVLKRSFKKDATVIAQYIYRGKKDVGLKITGRKPFTVSIGNDPGSPYASVLTEGQYVFERYVKPFSAVALSYSGSDFIGWVNENDMVYENANYQFTAVVSNSFTLRTADDTGTYFVEFRDSGNQLKASGGISSLEELAALAASAAIPSRYGKVFKYWQLSDGTPISDITDISILEGKLGPITGNLIVFTPYYEDTGETCTITVRTVLGSSIWADNDSVHSYNVGTMITLSAESINNYYFRCWAVEEEGGSISVSGRTLKPFATAKSCSVQATSDRVIYAIYSMEPYENPDPTITFECEATNIDGKNVLALRAVGSVPQSLGAVQSGVLYVGGNDYNAWYSGGDFDRIESMLKFTENAATGSLEIKSPIKHYFEQSTDCMTNFAKRVNVDGKEDGVRYARAYLITGDNRIIYSDVYVVTWNYLKVYGKPVGVIPSSTSSESESDEEDDEEDSEEE